MNRYWTKWNWPQSNNINFQCQFHWTFLSTLWAVAYRWTDECPHNLVISLTKCWKNRMIWNLTKNVFNNNIGRKLPFCAGYKTDSMLTSICCHAESYWQHGRSRKSCYNRRVLWWVSFGISVLSAPFSLLSYQFSSKENDISRNTIVKGKGKAVPVLNYD
jgi:hypothetical protein